MFQDIITCEGQEGSYFHAQVQYAMLNLCQDLPGLAGAQNCSTLAPLDLAVQSPNTSFITNCRGLCIEGVGALSHQNHTHTYIIYV